MNYYEEIRDKLIKSEIYDRVKDYTKDRNKVKVYFELMSEVGKKYNERNLRYMRSFYDIFFI